MTLFRCLDKAQLPNTSPFPTMFIDTILSGQNYKAESTGDKVNLSILLDTTEGNCDTWPSKASEQMIHGLFHLLNLVN